MLEDGAFHCIRGVVEINKIIKTCTCEATISKKIGEKMISTAEILTVKNKNGVTVNKVIDKE